MRILVLIVIGLLLYMIIGGLFRKKYSSKSRSDLGEMVRCKHCGLHVLQQEAIQSDNDYYCSQEHLEINRQNKQ